EQASNEARENLNEAVNEVNAGDDNSDNGVGNQNRAARPRRTRRTRCGHCGVLGHNARNCLMRVGVQAVVDPSTTRHVRRREEQVAMQGVGVYNDHITGNMYFRVKIPSNSLGFESLIKGFNGSCVQAV
ncbi:hypothetical protein LINGRAHAP2_LOCUS15906, partial [Linum grandiflorum]